MNGHLAAEIAGQVVDLGVVSSAISTRRREAEGQCFNNDNPCQSRKLAIRMGTYATREDMQVCLGELSQ